MQHVGEVAERERRRELGVEVRRFVTEHHRVRRISTTLHVGTPGGVRRVLTDDAAWDEALRADLLVRLLESCPPGAAHRVWLTRGGDGAIRDADLGWLRAARTAAAVAHLPLPSFVVVTRSGWRDLLRDECRTWSRARPLDPGGG